MRVVAYIRVSTDNEDQKNSLETQQYEFHEWCKRNNHTIASNYGVWFDRTAEGRITEGVYADEGISGTSLRRREAFKKMLVDAKKKEFDIVYVKGISRFSRNVEVFSKAIDDLKELNISVYFQELSMSTRDVGSELITKMLAVFAEQESVLKSTSIKIGIRKAQKDGKFTSPQPFGYDKIDGFLVVNPIQAEVVKTIYNMYLNENDGTGKICRYLNSQKILTQSGVKWSQAQVCRILDNTIYKGLQITHTTQSLDIKRKTSEMVNEDEQIRIQKDELVIIDKETFLKVQQEREKRKEMLNNNFRHSNETMLSNLLFCPKCKTGLKRKRRKAYVRLDNTKKDLGYEWCCATNDMYGKDKCAYRSSMPEVDIIAKVKETILEMQEEEYVLSGEAVEDEIANTYNYNKEEIKEKIRQLEDEINNLNEDSISLLKFNSKKAITDEQYIEQNSQLQQEIKEKKFELNRLNFLEKEKEEMYRKHKDFVKYIKAIDVNNLTNNILKKIIKRIEIGDIENNEGVLTKTVLILPNYYFYDLSDYYSSMKSQ